MTSEDQINKGLASNSGSASESEGELYPDSPTKISDATAAVRDKKTSTNQGLYPSKPSTQVKVSRYSRPPVSHGVHPGNQRSRKRQPTSY